MPYSANGFRLSFQLYGIEGKIGEDGFHVPMEETKPERSKRGWGLDVPRALAKGDCLATNRRKATWLHPQ